MVPIVHKYKTKLIAKNFSQILRIDFGEPYSLVVKINSIHVLLTLVTQHNFKIHQFDVKTPFLNGLLEEDIYMQILEGQHIKLTTF
jgi:hypothetical protein